MFKRSHAVLILSIILLASCFTTRRSIPVEEGWELLGERKVNFLIRDNDEVIITNRNLFTAIQFYVEDRDIKISGLKITFENGDKLEPSLDDEIRANQKSRVIDLAREGRIISKIEFKYRTVGSIVKGRANVLIYGKKYYRPDF
jgi:hypothetical protein